MIFRPSGSEFYRQLIFEISEAIASLKPPPSEKLNVLLREADEFERLSTDFASEACEIELVRYPLVITVHF